jgi:hypothetical protein
MFSIMPIILRHVNMQMVYCMYLYLKIGVDFDEGNKSPPLSPVCTKTLTVRNPRAWGEKLMPRREDIYKT